MQNSRGKPLMCSKITLFMYFVIQRFKRTGKSTLTK
jgi:hypothetical protein